MRPAIRICNFDISPFPRPRQIEPFASISAVSRSHAAATPTTFGLDSLNQLINHVPKNRIENEFEQSHVRASNWFDPNARNRRANRNHNRLMSNSR
jgi:hypothetical protein